MRVFVVCWKWGSESWVDEVGFRNIKEAITYAKIESTQMEKDGCEWKVYPVDFAEK